MPNSPDDKIRFVAIPYLPLIPNDPCDSAWHGSKEVPSDRVCIIYEDGAHGETIIREVWAVCEECAGKYNFTPDIKRVERVEWHEWPTGMGTTTNVGSYNDRGMVP